MGDATRTEGGALICRFCNRTLTFNFMARPAEPCSCEQAVAHRLAESLACAEAWHNAWHQATPWAVCTHERCVEAKQLDCTGAWNCTALTHVHGCHADQGACDAPDEHGRRIELTPGPRATTQAQTLAWVAERWPDRVVPIWRAAKLCEEAGEVMGAVIKVDEGRKTWADVEQETAQLVICAMALAESVGFDLDAAVDAEYDRCTASPDGSNGGSDG